jgi:hypothetical protein
MVSCVVSWRRPSAGTVSGSSRMRRPSTRSSSATSSSRFVKLRRMVRTSTFAAPPTRRSRGSTWTSSTSTVSTRLA